MNTAKGSTVFYLLVFLAFVVVLLALPFPSYETKNNSWFLGTSIGSTLLGKENEGVPLYKVARKVATASVTNPLDISCTTDSDCKDYVVANQCTAFCGNLAQENSEAVAKLNNRRICDPTVSLIARLGCECVANKCVSLK